MARNPITFGVLSDTHIGYRQYGLKKREEDFQNAFTDAVIQMNLAGIRHILHGGDIFNTRNPSSKSVEFMKALNKWLISKEMTMWCIDGNHDFCVPSWMEVCRDLGATSEYGFKSVANRRFSVMDYTITGVPFINQFPDDLKEPGDVLLLHTPVVEFAKYPGEGIPTVDDLPCDLYDLIVVGDTHVSEYTTRRDGGCLVISPGSTEMNSSSEPADKHWYSIELSDAAKPAIAETHDIKTRRVIKLDITNEEDLQNAAALLKDAEADEPLVLGHYLNTVPNARARMKAAVDTTKVILRPEPIGAEAAAIHATSEETRPISDYVTDFLSTDDPTFDLAVMLASEHDGNKPITDWIDSRTEVLENA